MWIQIRWLRQKPAYLDGSTPFSKLGKSGFSRTRVNLITTKGLNLMLHIQKLPTFTMATHLTILSPSPERAPHPPATVWEIQSSKGLYLILHIQELRTFTMATNLTILSPSPERVPHRPATVWEIQSQPRDYLMLLFSRVTYLYYGNPFNNTKS